ncbi:hypothetical protein OsJ_30053 [Oryza sativa Japonica Group]|uniref:Uncharacterized protein n=1 Tax=Oryza sativa subsp. japonica TaxID=39947 RepID=B9G4M1_ORYSJ|nr:hypothetical protein OsJ_30053 [Oryza sativa Japonica Group]
MPTGMNYLACTGMGGHYLCPTAIPSSLSPMANRQLPRERERERENAPPPLWTSSPPPWNHSPCPVIKGKLMDAIEGHVLGEAQLMAVF